MLSQYLDDNINFERPMNGGHLSYSKEATTRSSDPLKVAIERGSLLSEIYGSRDNGQISSLFLFTT